VSLIVGIGGQSSTSAVGRSLDAPRNRRVQRFRSGCRWPIPRRAAAT